MKGIILFEDANPTLKNVYCINLNNSDVTMNICPEAVYTLTGVRDGMKTAACNKDDTYDFETGALIALMKMCGKEKALKAVEELYSLKEPRGADLDGDILESKVEHMAKKNAELLGENSRLNYIKSCNESTIESLENTRDLLINKNNELIEEIEKLKSDKDKTWKKYQRNIQKKQDRINELEAQVIASEDDKQKNIEYYEKEIERLNNVSITSLKEKIEKLKLDCEKLQHGYADSDNVPSGHWDGDILDIVFLPGRACGKQYKTLVEMFKKIDQKKVDTAYKEAYNTTLPVWQKEAFKQLRKDQLDSLLEAGKYVVPTKREEMWGKILEASKCPPIEIKVAKQDITTFLRELQDKIPEAMWNGSECLPTENIVPYWFKHDYIYFALIGNIDKGKLKLCYSEEHRYWIKTTIDYLPPMRWDLFKKGRLAVKVNYNNYKEFYEACEKEIGKKPSTIYTGEYTVSICKKDGFFEIFTIEDQKETGRKIVDWEDVR